MKRRTVLSALGAAFATAGILAASGRTQARPGADAQDPGHGQQPGRSEFRPAYRDGLFGLRLPAQRLRLAGARRRQSGQGRPQPRGVVDHLARRHGIHLQARPRRQVQRRDAGHLGRREILVRPAPAPRQGQCLDGRRHPRRQQRPACRRPDGQDQARQALRGLPAGSALAVDRQREGSRGQQGRRRRADLPPHQDRGLGRVHDQAGRARQSLRVREGREPLEDGRRQPHRRDLADHPRDVEPAPRAAARRSAFRGRCDRPRTWTR